MGFELNGPREVLTILMVLADNEKTNIVLILVFATFLNLTLTLIVIVRGAHVAVDIDWLLRASRKLAAVAEARFLRELHARPTPRLLLEGPKSLARSGQIGSNYENSGSDNHS